MRNNGFFNTFISICSGTEIFPELTKYSLFRMVWHLILISIIGGCVNVAFRYHPFSASYEKYSEKLQRKFGDIKFSEKGITPSVNPDKRGTVRYNNLRTDYFPKREALKSFKPDDNNLFGIAWTPQSAVVWLLYNKKPSPFMPLLIPEVTDRTQMEKGMSFLYKQMQGTDKKLLSLYDVSEIYQIHLTPSDYTQIPFSEFRTNIMGVPLKIPTIFMLFLFFEILVNCLMIAPIYILIFTLFSFFLGKSEMLSLKFKQLLIIGIYTGFPGIVVATLYTALDLPYLDFQSIYLLSYLIYSFPVFARLRIAQLQEKK